MRTFQDAIDSFCHHCLHCLSEHEFVLNRVVIFDSHFIIMSSLWLCIGTESDSFCYRLCT